MKTITIYSTPTCGFCQQLKAFLKENAIPFTDHNVAEDEAAREEMQKITDGGSSVPVIVFNQGQTDEEIQVGYDPEKVQKTLSL
mgnify:CR=1 FL=1